MLDDLDDPVFARVRAARPVPPLTLWRSISRRSSVRRGSGRRTAIAIAVVVALAAVIALLAMPAAAPRKSIATNGPSPPADDGTYRAERPDAETHEGPSVDAIAQARAWVNAMRAADFERVVALTGVPLLHRGLCAKRGARYDARRRRFAEASNTKAVHQLATCIAHTVRSPFFRPRWNVDRDVDVETSSVSSIKLAPDDRKLRAHLNNLAKDHALIIVTIEIRDRPDVPRMAGESAEFHFFLFAVRQTGDGGQVDAVLDLGVKFVD